MKLVRIDYGNGVIRYFTRRSIRNVRRYLRIPSITRKMLREVTREWAESMPSVGIPECAASRFGRDFSDTRSMLKEIYEY